MLYLRSLVLLFMFALLVAYLVAYRPFLSPCANVLEALVAFTQLGLISGMF